MTERQWIAACGWLLVALGCLVATLQVVVGVDLTEDQLLARDYPWWLSVLVCQAAGILLLRKAGSD